MRITYVVTGFGVENGEQRFGSHVDRPDPEDAKRRAIKYAERVTERVRGTSTTVLLPVSVVEERVETRVVWPATKS